MSLIKKYSDADFSGFLDLPEEDTFNAWIQKRVSKKKGNYPSQRALNIISSHINKLFSEFGVTAEDAFFHAEDGAWDSIKVNWVLNAIQKDYDGYSANIVPIKKTKDMTLAEELSREWGK